MIQPNDPIMNPAGQTDISLANGGTAPQQAAPVSMIDQASSETGYKSLIEMKRKEPGRVQTPQYGNYNSPDQNQKIEEETQVAKYQIDGQLQQEQAMNSIINRGLDAAYEDEAAKFAQFENSLARKNANVLNAVGQINGSGSGGLDSYKKNEGFRGKIYTDSEGHLTVGYGHKLTNDDKRTGRYASGMSEAQAHSLLQSDVTKHNQGLYKRNPWLKQQPRSVQIALEDMAFNMGSLTNWRNTTDAIRAGNYSLASNNIANSKYQKQTGNRALRNAQLIASAQMA